MKINEYHKKRGLKRKIELILSMGGSCKLCGYNKNITALDFHHLNPKEKNFKLDIRMLASTKMLTLLKEAKKCIVVCSNCHRELHNPQYTISDLNKKLEYLNNTLPKPKIRTINKPKCIDCGVEINYTSKRCKKCSSIMKRKTSRPPYKQLMNEINETNYVIVGKKYGVADNTIRKWVRHYEKENIPR